MAQTPVTNMNEMAASSAAKETYFNDAIRRLEVVGQIRAIDKDLTEPPSGPEDGDIYVVADSATGDWYGYDGQVAYYQSTGWKFFEMSEGMLVWVIDEQILYVYMGSSLGLVAHSSSYVYLMGGFQGTLANDEYISIAVPEALTIPDDFAGSYAVAAVDPADTTGNEFTLYHNATEIGSVTFAEGEFTGTYSMPSSGAGPVSLAAGDRVVVKNQASADSDTAGVAFTIKCERT